MKATKLTTPEKIEINQEIIFNRPNSLVICKIVEVRDKAVKVDYAVEPISESSSMSCIVFTYGCWIPKSVILADEYGCLTTKKWFENNFTGGWHIKRYFEEKGKKVFA